MEDVVDLKSTTNLKEESFSYFLARYTYLARDSDRMCTKVRYDMRKLPSGRCVQATNLESEAHKKRG